MGFSTSNPSLPAPAKWKLELFAIFFFGPIVLAFAAIGWTGLGVRGLWGLVTR